MELTRRDCNLFHGLSFLFCDRQTMDFGVQQWKRSHVLRRFVDVVQTGVLRE